MPGGGGSVITVSLHVLGITDDGRLWHASQPVPVDGSAGSWKPWEEVKAGGSQQPRSLCQCGLCKYLDN
jgi:hypothetical protein